VLFQCLTGELPFDRETDAALMHAHLFAPPPRVSTLGVDVPQALDEVFARGMAKQPADRFESARELIGACRSALATVRPATLDRSPAFPRPEQEAQEELPATPREPQVPTASATPGDDARRDAEPSISARLTQAPWPATAAPEPERLKAATDAGPRIARRSRAIGWPAALVVALLLAAVVGYLLGSGSKRSDPRPLKRIAVGSISLAAPAGWTAADEQVSGLDLTDRISLRHSSGVVLVAGRLSSFAPGLDPSQPALRARFRTARKQLVSIAGRSAVTYAGDRRDGGSAWIALLPDSRGWTAAGCSSVARKPRLRTLCARVAGTLSASDAKPVALGPDPSLAKALNSGVGELNSGRARLVARLRVRSTALRAKAAAQLATVYASVATGLERATVRVQDRPLVTDLVRALRREAAAFRQLAGAAKRRQRRTYALTRDRVSSAAREARQALARLDRGGYR
jgi:hypothetical protein